MYGRNLTHFLLYFAGLSSARTQTTPRERELLARLAPGQRTIVEIGVFEGASSYLLRRSLDADANLFCIDPFPPGRLGFSMQLWIARHEMGRCGSGELSLIRECSYQVVRRWERPIDLLFYDAEIQYEAVRRDFGDWSRFLAEGGRFLLHTSHSTEVKPVPAEAGTVRFVADLPQLFPEFEVVDQIDSITIIGRRKKRRTT